MNSLLAQHGFLPTRGSVMLDFVFVAMFAVVPLMGFGIWLAKRRQYEWHMRVQLTLAIVLLVAVAAFEIDLNFITKNWRPLAEPSPYYASGWVDRSLWLHLSFAVPTPLLWVFVIVQALRRFPRPVAPSPYSAQHLLWARLAAIGMTLTAVTGWLFYYLAFIA